MWSRWGGGVAPEGDIYMVVLCGPGFKFHTLLKLGRLHATGRTWAGFSKLELSWMGGGEGGGNCRRLGTMSKASEIVNEWACATHGAGPDWGWGAGDSRGRYAGPCGILKAPKATLINNHISFWEITLQEIATFFFTPLCIVWFCSIVCNEHPLATRKTSWCFILSFLGGGGKQGLWAWWV